MGSSLKVEQQNWQLKILILFELIYMSNTPTRNLWLLPRIAASTRQYGQFRVLLVKFNTTQRLYLELKITEELALSTPFL